MAATYTHTFKIGTRVQLPDMGLMKAKKGTIVRGRTDGRGVPVDVPGAYNALRRIDRVILCDDGSYEVAPAYWLTKI
jgi:hypothetical protein